MLVEFSVENFGMFKEKQTFSMVAGSSKIDRKDGIFKTGHKACPNLLSVAGIFGPNASGKTTFLKAFEAFFSIEKSSKFKFALNNTDLEMVFLSDKSLYKLNVVSAGSSKCYTYMGEINPKGTEKSLHSRCLIPPLKYENLFDTLKNQFIFYTGQPKLSSIEKLLMSNKVLRKKISHILSRLGFNILDINSKGNTIQIIKNRGNIRESIELKNESSDIKALISLLPGIIEALQEGKILIVDDLNTNLHPLITSRLIDWFANEKKNPKKAQLIFTTNDVSLLDQSLDRHLRKDQVWTIDNTYLGSQIKSIAEYRHKANEDIQRNYLIGRYGGIPHGLPILPILYIK